VSIENYLTLPRYLEIFQRARPEILKLNDSFAAYLEAYEGIQAYLATTQPITKSLIQIRLTPFKSSLNALAVLKDACLGPHGIPTELLLPEVEPPKPKDTVADNQTPQVHNLDFTFKPPSLRAYHEVKDTLQGKGEEPCQTQQPGDTD
jgi:hypothetical protein